MGETSDDKVDPWVRWASNDSEIAALVSRGRVELGPERVDLAANEALEQTEDRHDKGALAAEAVFKTLLQDLLKEGEETRERSRGGM